MTIMTQVGLVALGSALGGVARWLTGRFTARQLGTTWPFATFVVNVLGCFFLGGFAVVAGQGWMQPHHHLLLAIGFAGSFTTFSTFGFETDLLLRQRKWVSATLFVFLSVFCGLLATRLGARLAELLQ